MPLLLDAGDTVDRYLLLFVVLLYSIKKLQFVILNDSAFVIGAVLDTDRLSGFSKKRFYGQFLTFILLLLTLPLLLSTTKCSHKFGASHSRVSGGRSW
ncbi:hypothetical protein [Pseudomonas sp. FEN]|uniref:hypothetical protein n=1 Tax=Pseudomonas sp. FEN TaxID=2767468 RepID=UPI001CD3BB1B|nr:hypothetical protein [Pseudomonas sp. FEN]